MKAKLWQALVGAMLAHAAVFTAIALWPQRPTPGSPPDFVAVGRLLSEELLPEPYGPSVCRVHNVKMTVVEVPIVYGLLWELADPRAYRAANPDVPPRAVRAAQFPHSERWIWGGCCVTDQRNTRIYLCTECERAEKEWKLAQRK